jgi:YD repeat-containing protein
VIKGRTTERFLSDSIGSAYNTYPTSLKIEKYENSAYYTSRFDSNSYVYTHFSWGDYYILGESRFIKEFGSRKTYFNGLICKRITLSNVKLSSKTTTEYEGSTTNPIITSNTFTYNNTNGLLKTKTKSASYKSVKTQYQYPSDINTGVYTSMVDSNMLNYPVEILSYINSNITGSQLNTYKIENDNYVPYQVFVLETSTPLSLLTLYNGTTKDSLYSTTPEVTYDYYDTRGNLLYQTEKNGITTSFLWDTYKEYLMAKIEGDTYTWAGASCNYDSKTLWTTLKTLYPNAFVTTYSYKPLYGLINQTVQNGVKTTYDYDTFGRLSTIINNDNKKLKKVVYNYANY